MTDWSENKCRSDLAMGGWSVAVHNDYHVQGVLHTFWLFTHPSGVWAKGEGLDDEVALNNALAQARQRRPPLAGPGAGEWATLAEVEKAHVLAILAECKQDRSMAARALGIGERTLYRKLVEYGIGKKNGSLVG